MSSNNSAVRAPVVIWPDGFVAGLLAKAITLAVDPDPVTARHDVVVTHAIAPCAVMRAFLQALIGGIDVQVNAADHLSGRLEDLRLDPHHETDLIRVMHMVGIATLRLTCASIE
jgi:hypothetical protein